MEAKQARRVGRSSSWGVMQFDVLSTFQWEHGMIGPSMGYNLHVTRKAFWSDPDGPIISLDEWVAYVATDPDLEPDWENPGPENARFIKHPDQWPIWWSDRGEIYTKNPDPLVVFKLVQIAKALGAKVLGDDDEVYGVDPSDPTKFHSR